MRGDPDLLDLAAEKLRNSVPVSASHRENLRLEDPALRVKTSLAMATRLARYARCPSVATARRRLVRPAPVLNFWHVFAMLIDVIAVLGQLVAEMLRHVCGFRD